MLTNSYIAWLIAILQFTLQIGVLCYFLSAADIAQTDNDWELNFICPSNNLKCEPLNSVAPFTNELCAFIIILFLFRDFVDGFLIIYEGINISDVNSILAGLALLFVSLFALVVSLLYNHAICRTTTAYFQNAAILLFLNDLDEKVYAALQHLCPFWVKHLEADIADEAETIKNKYKIGKVDKEEEDGRKSNSVVTTDGPNSMITTDGKEDGNIEKKEERTENKLKNEISIMQKIQDKIDKLQNELDVTKKAFRQVSKVISINNEHQTSNISSDDIFHQQHGLGRERRQIVQNHNDQDPMADRNSDIDSFCRNRHNEDVDEFFMIRHRALNLSILAAGLDLEDGLVC